MAKKQRPPTLPPAEVKPIRLDLGCGPNKQAGFTGVDCRSFPGVDVVMDLGGPWPWESDSVDEVFSSHFVEHLTAEQRIHFVNELHRVLKKGHGARIITPHWNSCRAYGDLTHQWPPVSEFWFYYLKKSWRDQNAPHNDQYTCDFEPTWGYNPHPALVGRAEEYQQDALQWKKEAAQDIIATLIKL